MSMFLLILDSLFSQCKGVLFNAVFQYVIE